MAGGIGSRFWPLSVPQYPKQFIDILGCGKTLIQMTVDRFQGICPMDNFWVVTNEKYVDIVRTQLPEIPVEHILAEPSARNTAPCIAWACRMIHESDARANVVVTPSDAIVMDVPEFRRVISGALDFTADSDAIVTIGIRPSRPETGYGYVECAQSACPGSEIRKVLAFKEKPCAQVAAEYVSKGNYLWNAGIFVWNVKTISESIRRYEPQIAGIMDLIAQGGNVQELFPQCNKISIDYAVMEPASLAGNVYTFPADFGWSDLGNWASLYDRLDHDVHGNAAVGNVHLYECSDCVVHTASASKVVLQGLDGYIVSEKDGQILVCRRSEEQRIRDFSQN